MEVQGAWGRSGNSVQICVSCIGWTGVLWHVKWLQMGSIWFATARRCSPIGQSTQRRLCLLNASPLPRTRL